MDNSSQWYSVELIGVKEDDVPKEFVSSLLTVNDVQNCILSLLRKADIRKINSYLYGQQIYGSYDVFHEDESLYEGFFSFDNPKCSPFLYAKETGEEIEAYYRYFVYATSCSDAVKAVENLISRKGLPHDK